MKIANIKTQREGDTAIDYDNWQGMVRAGNANQVVSFDPRYFHVQKDSTGLYVTFKNLGIKEWKFAFGWTLNGNECKINAGSVIFEGRGTPIEVEEATLTLSGSTSFVFVQHAWGSESAVIGQVSDRPYSSATTMFRTLVGFEAMSAKVYQLIQTYSIGDISFALPTM